MLLNNKIRDLVSEIDQKSCLPGSELDSPIKSLVRELHRNAAKDDARQRYAAYNAEAGELDKFPLDKDGYAEAIDPLLDEASFFDCWRRFGVVVGKEIASRETCNTIIERIRELALELSNGEFDVRRQDTYDKIPVDSQGTPLLSRGFFEIYHDEALAQIRQLVRMYIHQTVLWGTPALWTSFDRFGIKLPEHSESYALPLHVDQNPLVHAHFKTVQGVLALSDCPEERGTFVAVPGSKKLFSEYGRMAGQGEYVELKRADPIAKTLEDHTQALPLHSGDLVTWDSRTTHSNTANRSSDIRFVAYTSAGPVPIDKEQARAARQASFRSGLGSNVREALMHASKPPRYTNQEEVTRVRRPENLNLLGELLYGERSYDDIA